MIVLGNDQRRREPILYILFIALLVFVPGAAVRAALLALLVLRLLSVLYSLLVPRAVSVTRLTDTVYANCHQPFDVTLRIRNRFFVPIYLMSVQDTVSSGIFADDEAAFRVTLRPLETRDITYRAVGRARGAYTAGPVRLEGHDPLRTYRYRRSVESPLRIIVYPTVHRLDLPQRTGLPSGSISVTNKLYEDLTRYSAIREYQPGDEMKRINWKASARMGKLFSMEYQPSIYFPIVVLVNLSERSYPVRGREWLVNRVTETAASLVFYAVGIKQELGLVTTGVLPETGNRPSAPVKAGYGNAVGILEILACVQPDPEYVNPAEHLLQAGIRVPNGSKIFVVSPPLTQDEADRLAAYRRKGYSVMLFEVHSRHMNQADRWAHTIPTHVVAEHGEELVHG